MKTSTKTKRTSFQTPHELASKLKQSKATKSGRDAFGGRVGGRMSKINLVVINAGTKGVTVSEVADRTGEPSSLVSAQLGWIVSHIKLATRKEEKAANGKPTFRYFAKAN